MICALEAVRRWQAPNQYAPADHSLEHHSTFHFADTSSNAEYERLLQQQGIPILAIFNAPTGQLNGGEASGDYFFILPVPPTALVCFHDLMAIGLMHVIRAKNIRSQTIVRRIRQHCHFRLHSASTTFEQPS